MHDKSIIKNLHFQMHNHINTEEIIVNIVDTGFPWDSS